MIGYGLQPVSGVQPYPLLALYHFFFKGTTLRHHFHPSQPIGLHLIQLHLLQPIYLFIYVLFQAEKFGDSFVLESRISKKVQESITQAVSISGWSFSSLM